MSQQATPATSKKNVGDFQHSEYLTTHKYRNYHETELEAARNMLQKEMQVRI